MSLNWYLLRAPLTPSETPCEMVGPFTDCNAAILWSTQIKYPGFTIPVQWDPANPNLADPPTAAARQRLVKLG